MRAYHIMMFLLLFNLSISVVSALGIYPAYVSTDPAYDVTSTNAGNSALYRFGGGLLATSLAAVMAGSLISYFTKLPAAAAVAYTLFATQFWNFTIQTFSVLWAIGGGNVGMTVVITVFGIMVGIIFLAGLMQMVSGGWRAVE